MAISWIVVEEEIVLESEGEGESDGGVEPSAVPASFHCSPDPGGQAPAAVSRPSGCCFTGLSALGACEVHVWRKYLQDPTLPYHTDATTRGVSMPFFGKCLRSSKVPYNNNVHQRHN